MSQNNGHVDLEGLELWRSDATILTREQLEARDKIAIHLEQCTECSKMAEAHTLMFAQSQSIHHPEACPGEDLWIEFATGLCSEQQLDGLMTHASHCERCAAFMKLAVDTVSDNEIVAEATSLSSATPAWQMEMAHRLAASQVAASAATTRSLDTPRRLWPIGWWFSWPAYSVAALLVAALALGIWIRTGPSVDTLVARAYDARRLTELRIPGGASVAMYSPVRGRATSSEWPELLELKLAADRGLQKTPDSPFWHQIAGRGLILQADPTGALANFQVAYARNPVLPGIQFDLGSAYFELGDQTHDTTNYGYAAEAFSRYLDELHHPDSVALFNRALCWKRMGLHDQAIRDLQQALESEKQADWQQAIRAEIAALQRHNGLNRFPAASHTEFLPAASSAFVWNGPAATAGSYENALNRLFDEGFNPSDPANCSRYKQLALDGEAHHDSWVSDWMCTVRTPAMAKADSLLASSVRANQSGQSDRALAFAVDAMRLYSETSNHAGLTRASFERVYALQRAGRAQDCLIAIPPAISSQSSARYSYLRIMMLMEEASCHEMAGSVLPVQMALEGALANSSASAFPSLHARAQGFLAAYFTQQGLPEQGWNVDVAGLQFCLDFGCSSMRQYQFVSDLTDGAIALGLNSISIDLAASGSSMAHATGNLQIDAYALELLGQRQLEGSRIEDAKHSFSAADTILTSLGDTEASRQYRADWTADRAKLLAREGHDNLALSALDHASPVIGSAQSIVLQLNYWSQRALLERTAGHNARAMTSARKAVDCANQVLGGLTNLKDRQAWQTRAALAYDLLVDSLLHNHREKDAFSAWEVYRAAAEQPVAAESSKSILVNYPIARQYPKNTLTFVFARLIDHYAVFVLDANGSMLRVYSPPATADAVDQLVHTFAQLCADPRSQITDINVAGRALYSILFSDIRPTKELRIEADGRLETLPFNALILPDGTYLGKQAAITLLPGFWTMRRQNQPVALTASSPILVVGASAGGVDSIPGAYDESREVTARFTHAELINEMHPSLGRILRALGSAEIFHFSGHAIRQQDSIHLVLGSSSSDELSSTAFTPSSLRACKLVVLAACSTLGSESHSGSLISEMPEVFLRAGVENVVASHWQVDSQATRILMLEFYDELLKGNSVDIALLNAETKLSTNAAFQHPYYWSGFTVMQS